MELRSIKKGDIMYYVYSMNAHNTDLPEKIKVKSVRTVGFVTVITFEKENRYFGVKKAVGYYTGNVAVNNDYIFCTVSYGLERCHMDAVKGNKYDELLFVKKSIEDFLKTKY